MTDVQVSNARRIIFTAAAIVAFWVLAWRGYWIIYDELSIPAELFELLPFPAWTVWVAICSAFALVPTMFYSIAAQGYVLRLRDRGVLFAGGLFATSLGLSLWLGMSDVKTAFDKTGPHSGFSGSFPLALAKARPEHAVSWLYLLLPIILTTAFVIFGAWRRAVRDAEVDAVGEDE